MQSGMIWADEHAGVAGCGQWYLVGKGGTNDGRDFPLSGDEVTVGRGDRCALHVTGDGTVSRRHARLRVGGNGASVADLGSTNGTRVNGRVIAGETALLPGDTIAFGCSAFVLTLHDGPK